MPSGDAAAKARQRARNGNTGSGSSGSTSRVAQMEKRTFRQIQKSAEHQCDFAGELTDARLLANNTVMVSFVVPLAYMDDVMHLVVESRGQFAMFRGYLVPKPQFIPYLDEQPDPDSTAGDATSS